MPLCSVIVITRNRPGMVVRCLDHLARQRPVTAFGVEILVVDSSPGDETWQILKARPHVRRFRIRGGKDNMPQARNLGIAESRGDVVAFLDDDSLVEQSWLAALLRHYGDPAVGGVGGRLIDHRLAPADNPAQPVGRVGEDGSVYINFTRRTVGPIDVHHLPGGNMSFRRDVFKAVGGFDPLFTGPNYNEETEFCVRVGKAGYRLIYDPAAAVNHMNAPREGSERGGFDRRLNYYAGRNKVYFLLKHYPLTWRRFRREFLATLKCQLDFFIQEPGWRSLRALVYRALGLGAGIIVYLRSTRRSCPRPPPAAHQHGRGEEEQGDADSSDPDTLIRTEQDKDAER